LDLKMADLTVKSHRDQLEERGHTLLPRREFEFDVGELRRIVESMAQAGAGIRRLLDVPWCAELGERIRLHPVLQPLLPRHAVPVQCTLFAKSGTRNWLVALHQDLSIPVAERIEAPGCAEWSEKGGDVFVQPPVSVLEQLVAVRLHVDDCDQGNGALRVVPGSHRLGRLSAAEGASARTELGEQTVRASAGDALVMKPLLLHASSKAANPLPRRVLHFVFGRQDLPDGLRWPPSRRAV
jgi:hypothetical protein